MEEVYEKIKLEHPKMNDYFVIGSSRHEIIIIPDDVVDKIDDLQEIHSQIQETELSQADKLTEKIYKYDAKKKQLTIAESKTKKSEQSEKAEIKEQSESHGRSH